MLTTTLPPPPSPHFPLTSRSNCMGRLMLSTYALTITRIPIKLLHHLPFGIQQSMLNMIIHQRILATAPCILIVYDNSRRILDRYTDIIAIEQYNSAPVRVFNYNHRGYALVQTKEFNNLILTRVSPRGGGGGGTDSLSLGTNCETTAPPFWPLTAPVLLPPNLQPPIFMEAQGQPLEINIE